MSATLDRIKEEVKTLGADEQVREFRSYRPITVEGQQLSEMVIGDRR
jgi:hypothetical protein